MSGSACLAPERMAGRLGPGAALQAGLVIHTATSRAAGVFWSVWGDAERARVALEQVAGISQSVDLGGMA